MKSQSIKNAIRSTIFVCLCFASTIVASQESKTVLGPENPDLYHGANALLEGDAEEGVRLTLRGLETAVGRRQHNTALSNLCAGYIMLNQLETALSYCDQALAADDNYWRAYSNRALAYIELGRLEDAELDLQKAESIAGNSRTVKTVRSMLLDATDPVTPEIVIDDRRQPADEQDE